MTATPTFSRTLPLFDSEDRDVIQRLLHHAVANYDYDHPDRQIARDLYHEIREGEAIRLHVGSDLDDIVLTLVPEQIGADTGDVLERFIDDAGARDGEWQRVAEDLREYRESAALDAAEVTIGFEYLH